MSVKKLIIAIDPGTNGGIAWVDDDGIVNAAHMPEGMTAIADRITDLIFDFQYLTTVAVMEKVGTYQPGNSGPAAATFARHCGHLEAILYCRGVETEQVAPQKWMKPLNLPKDKAERKKAVQELMARKYPNLKVTLATADALAILTWFIKK